MSTKPGQLQSVGASNRPLIDDASVVHDLGKLDVSIQLSETRGPDVLGVGSLIVANDPHCRGIYGRLAWSRPIQGWSFVGFDELQVSRRRFVLIDELQRRTVRRRLDITIRPPRELPRSGPARDDETAVVALRVMTTA